MKTLVSNLGFDADHIFRALVEHDFRGRDTLLLFRPEGDNPRGSGAVEEIEGVTGKMYGNLNVEVEYVDPRDFESAVVEIKRRMEAADGDLVLNLAGGDRALLVAITVAAMFVDGEIEAASTFSDAFLERVPVTVPPMGERLEESDRRILEAVRGGDDTCTEISSRLDLSPSAVSRRLGRLEDAGFVERGVDGNERPVRLEFKGELSA